jgi:Arc/MetJ-type ribon-helix-helix transcriptional regulator
MWGSAENDTGLTQGKESNMQSEYESSNGKKMGDPTPRITISLPADLLKDLTARVGTTNRDRSAFVQRAIRQLLLQEKENPTLAIGAEIISIIFEKLRDADPNFSVEPIVQAATERAREKSYNYQPPTLEVSIGGKRVDPRVIAEQYLEIMKDRKIQFSFAPQELVPLPPARHGYEYPTSPLRDPPSPTTPVAKKKR